MLQLSSFCIVVPHKARITMCHMGLSENSGTLFWGPYNKDPTIKGTILGPPIFGNPHILSFLLTRECGLQVVAFPPLPRTSLDHTVRIVGLGFRV